MEELLRRYRKLIAEVTAAMAPLEARHRARRQCAPGCAACCQALTLLAIEAESVRRAFLALPPAAQEVIRSRASQPGDHCPFLLDDLCAIYPARPLICRTHGLAIGYVDEEREAIEVSACPRNFPDDFPLTMEDLLLLDPTNERLAAINREFCETLGRDAATRVTMRETLAQGGDPD
jgi:Fe-S-cluster containining protein